MALFTVCYCSAFLVLCRCLPIVLPSAFVTVYSSLGTALLSLIILYYTFTFFKSCYFDERVSPHAKAVLITGCDTGFGHEFAKRLDSKGFSVFACCLFPEGDGAKILQKTCSDRLRVLGLDVTKSDSVENALDYVQNNLNESVVLWAVVNNAGIYEGFDISWTKLESFQRCLEVNTIGPVRVTKAFLPLLRESKGRLVTVVSVAGRIAVPYMAAYTMSKYAMTAFMECFRQEMAPSGIQTISIQPEAFDTKMADVKLVVKNLKSQVDALDEKSREHYRDDYFAETLEFLERAKWIPSKKIYKVIDCLDDAVTLEHPSTIYRPCRNTFVAIFYRFMELIPLVFSDVIYAYGTRALGKPSARDLPTAGIPSDVSVRQNQVELLQGEKHTGLRMKESSLFAEKVSSIEGKK